MPRWIESIFRSSAISLLVRILATVMFWGSGIEKVVDFPGTVQEMMEHGLQPATLFAAFTALTLLGGSLLVILGGRFAWFGAGWLGIFTIMTIPIAHDFWNASAANRIKEFRGVREHLSVVGGLFFVAAYCWRAEMLRRNG